MGEPDIRFILMKTRERVYYLDWLRIFAVVMLVPFHTAMIFVTWSFHIKNDVLSQGLTDLNGFIHIWHMPLFFLVSGAGTWFALGFRSGGEYAKERLLRLFVPLVFGMLAIIPPQVYLERISRHQFTGSYFEFWPSIFTTGPYPQGNLSWHHLWFLAYLFVFSMLLLPIFLWMRSDKARARLSRTADFFSQNARVFLLAGPLVLIQFLLRLHWPDGNQNLIDDWANFFYHSTTFIFGSLLLTDRKYLEAIERNRYGALAVAVLCALVIKIISIPSDNIIAAMALNGFDGFNTWCWLLVLLGFGRKHLNFTNKVRDYAVEAALPFYILHQTFIIIIGFYVIQWRIALMLKFLLIIVLTFITVLMVYDLVVKRIGPIRFLFGMKSKKPSAG